MAHSFRFTGVARKWPKRLPRKAKKRLKAMGKPMPKAYTRHREIYFAEPTYPSPYNSIQIALSEINNSNS